MKIKKIAGLVLAELQAGNTYILVYDTTQVKNHEIKDLLRELGLEFGSRILGFGVPDTTKALRFIEVKPGAPPIEVQEEESNDKGE